MNQVGARSTNAASALLVGVSTWVRGIQEEIRRIAPFNSSVLISGPSGTGKELIAREIHARSPRAEQPFIAVNCAAFTGSLFESQMFGHLKGAFTGSQHSALGCFRAADGGTIFLDEIGELHIELQAKLLRALQEQLVVPLGSHEEFPVNVRVLAATNRNLIEEIAAHRFRDDLYYRLAVVTLRSVPLRERPEDLEVLVEYLLARQCVKHGLPYKPLSPSARARLQSYAWPGNVRELQNVLERAVLVSQGMWLEEGDIALQTMDIFPAANTLCERQETGLPLPIAPSAPTSGNSANGLDTSSLGTTDGHWTTMCELEKWHIRTTLEHTNYNQSEAARLLEMDRTVLRRRIQRFGLDAARSHPGRPRVT